MYLYLLQHRPTISASHLHADASGLVLFLLRSKRVGVFLVSVYLGLLHCVICLVFDFDPHLFRGGRRLLLGH